jgi:hypothetical protein
MKVFKSTIFFMSLMLFAGVAMAGDADVCYSHAKSAMQSDNLKDTTPLICGHSGTHSMVDLAMAGWSIVSVAQDQEMGTSGAGGISWMVVIQKQIK